MDWVKNNLVGLLTILLIIGGSYMALYINVSNNSASIIQLRSNVDDFSNTNNRLIMSLDKLEALYNESKTKDAVQDEKILQSNKELYKLESEIKNANQK